MSNSLLEKVNEIEELQKRLFPMSAYYFDLCICAWAILNSYLHCRIKYFLSGSKTLCSSKNKGKTTKPIKVSK